MTTYKNEEHFGIAGDKTVTVTLRFDVPEEMEEDTIFRNVALAANRLAEHGNLHTWVRKVTVEEK